MTITELKKQLSLTNADIAGFFGLSPAAYANSSAKKRYEQALISFYECVIKEREIKFKLDGAKLFGVLTNKNQTK